jgi:putative Mg2+ transporter-C (MgtC) family protein
MFDTIVHAMRDEFVDLKDAAAVVRVVLRLLVAAALGGALGYQRETHGKAAGLRTHILVAMGSAMFVMVPQQMGADHDAVSRVIQGLVAGIGFLGTGAIVKADREPHDHRGEVSGLTTAAGIWTTAAIGIAAGLGREVTAILATIFALVVLALLPTHIQKDKSKTVT